MKTVCVYHSIDLDGWMSAAIVKHWWNMEIKHQGDTLDFIGYNYGQSIPDLSEYDKVIMCDISFPKELMEVLFTSLQDSFIWCDHHISAIKDSEGLYYSNCEGTRDTTRAACEITWSYFFHGQPMPEIVRLLGRYDCFGHKGTNEEQQVLEFQYGARSVISSYEDAYNYLVKCVDLLEGGREVNYIWDKGVGIYKYLCEDAKQSYKNGFEIILSEYRDETCSEERLHKFICINKERFNPINFGIDYHKDGYDGCACFHRTAFKDWAFSLYNDNGLVDVSEIAKQFGGGGHKGASGFRIKELTQIF